MFELSFKYFYRLIEVSTHHDRTSLEDIHFFTPFGKKKLRLNVYLVQKNVVICKKKSMTTAYTFPINLAGGDPHNPEIEWAGIFATQDDTHVWSMQQVDNKYADPTMRVVVFPTVSPSRSELSRKEIKRFESAAAALLKGDSCAVVKDGETMSSISRNGSCFELHVGSGSDSKFIMDTFGIRGMVVYTQHVPTEFERDQHYFADSKGFNIKPIAEGNYESHHHH